MIPLLLGRLFERFRSVYMGICSSRCTFVRSDTAIGQEGLCQNQGQYVFKELKAHNSQVEVKSRIFI